MASRENATASFGDQSQFLGTVVEMEMVYSEVSDGVSVSSLEPGGISKFLRTW